jgi:FAD/FMN-containing dehydrogenase
MTILENECTSKQRMKSLPIWIKVLIFIIIVLIFLYIIQQWWISKVTKELAEPPLQSVSVNDHQQMVQDISEWMQQLPDDGGKLVRKPMQHSHLFGLVNKQAQHHIDLSAFRNIIDINQQYVHVQATALICQVIEYLLQFDYCLEVVPDMTHLTVSGLFAGVGGGAASFKYGAFSDSVVELEYVDGIGRIHTTSDLHALTSSLGTLGYMLSFKLRIRKVKPWVYTETETYDNFAEFQQRNEYFMTTGKDEIDFLDGTIFSPTQFVLITGTFVDIPDPNLPIFTARLEMPYWKRVQQGYKGLMKTYDYVYRHDGDGYYSTMNSPDFVHSGRLRKLLLRDELMTSTKLRTLLKRIGIKKFQRVQIEEEVGDFLIPLDKTIQFNSWFEHNIALYPLYICPAAMKPTLLMHAPILCIDLGVGYGVKKGNTAQEKMALKHQMMTKCYEMGGDVLKYFSVFKDEADFWQRYPPSTAEEYYRVKQENDPLNRFYSVSEKLMVKC